MIGFLVRNAWLVPFLPLLGAILAAVGGRWLKERSHWPVVLGIGLAFVVSLGLLFSLPAAHSAHGEETEAVAAAEGSGLESATGGPVHVYRWIQAGNLYVPVELRVDGLSTMMICMVTFVATIIAVFASGYMAGDPGYARFFSIVGLFVFAMTTLVMANNYVLAYAGWEGVGVCSYLLIGFWYAKPSAAAAAQKAFLVNRIGDVGFAIALFWMWSIAPEPGGSIGRLSYDNILNPSTLGILTYEQRFGLVLLLFWAATAKSAQIPLYTWLPDAMEGPTPVSALIHAATMVTAGVYLIARSSLLVVTVPMAQLIICLVGCATALLAAAIAVTQTDLKRVLAYSTVSQLGYMFMALGAGVGGAAQLAIVAALFHLFTHAFFKALLFLGSGSVMHAMGGVIDMRRFRGLRHRMPYTCWTFAIGGLALAGIVPFAGFWSKDEILTSLKLAGELSQGEGLIWGGVYTGIYWVAILTAFLTAFYTGRAFFLTFFGPEKLPSPDDPEAEPGEILGHAHDVDRTMSPGTPPAEAVAYATDLDDEDTHHASGMDEAARAAVAAAGFAISPPPAEVTHDPASHDGASGFDHGQGHDDHFGHESPPIMWVPLVVLAVGAVAVGAMFGPLTHWFEHQIVAHTAHFEDHIGHLDHATDWASILIGTLAGVAGIALSAWLYASPSELPATLARRFQRLYQASYNKFGVDELYQSVIGTPTWGLATISKYFDMYVIDGLVRLTAWMPRFVGREVLAPLQGGLIQLYAWTTAVGLAILLLLLLFA